MLSAGEASDARAEAPDGLRTRLMHPPLGPRGTDNEETRGNQRKQKKSTFSDSTED